MTTTQRIVVGNASIKGFVNFVKDNRLVVGTGSYTDRAGTTHYKESATIFLDKEYKGYKPEKGDYISVQNADLVVSPRSDDAEKLQVTFNLRFENQLTKLEKPVKKDAGATAGAATGTDQDI